MNYKYYLVVSFCCGDIWKTQEEIENILGRSDGSGFGFGARDLSYYFNHLGSLKAAVRKVRRMGKKIKCEAWEYVRSHDNFGVADYDEKKLSLKGVK